VVWQTAYVPTTTSLDAEASADAYVAIAKAIADPTRVQILRLAGATEELACYRLEKILPLSKATISYHIKILSRVQLLSVRREGKFFHYRLRREILDYYLPNILDRI
jgi:ArsR family transcriptional regulator